MALLAHLMTWIALAVFFECLSAYLRLVVKTVVNIMRKPPKIIAIATPPAIKSSVLLSIMTKQMRRTQNTQLRIHNSE